MTAGLEGEASELNRQVRAIDPYMALVLLSGYTQSIAFNWISGDVSFLYQRTAGI